MCFQVNIMLSHRLKGEMESSAKTRLPLHSIELFILRRRSTPLSKFGVIFTIMLFTKGGDSSEKALMTSFLAIHAKGGESISPKQKDCTHHQFQKFSLSIYI
jgi:hypothetical protein